MRLFRLASNSMLGACQYHTMNVLFMEHRIFIFLKKGNKFRLGEQALLQFLVCVSACAKRSSRTPMKTDKSWVIANVLVSVGISYFSVIYVICVIFAWFIDDKYYWIIRTIIEQLLNKTNNYWTIVFTMYILLLDLLLQKILGHPNQLFLKALVKKEFVLYR